MRPWRPTSRSSSRTSSECSSNYEETFETVVEEGDLGNGEKLVRIDKVTVRKKVEEVTKPLKVKWIDEPGSGDGAIPKVQSALYSKPTSALPSPYNSRISSKDDIRRSRTPSYERIDRRTPSRTPSEEKIHQDSCYYTQSYPTNGSLSKSSSYASIKLGSDENLRRTPSRERVDWDGSSTGSGSKGSEWYQEYRVQSFQNFNSKLERVLTRQEYDSHIAEIRGKFKKHLSEGPPGSDPDVFPFLGIENSCF